MQLEFSYWYSIFLDLKICDFFKKNIKKVTFFEEKFSSRSHNFSNFRFWRQCFSVTVNNILSDLQLNFQVDSTCIQRDKKHWLKSNFQLCFGHIQRVENFWRWKYFFSDHSFFSHVNFLKHILLTYLKTTTAFLLHFLPKITCEWASFK